MSSFEEEVMKIARKLEKVNNGEKPEDGVLDMLKRLKSMDMTLEILTKSRIGMTINDLRKKTSNDELSVVAKNLIRTWKKLLEGGKPLAKNGTSPLPHSESLASNLADIEKESSSSKAAPAKQQSFPPPATLEEEQRDKARAMLIKSLTHAELPDGTLIPEELAEKIEQKLYDVHEGCHSNQYRAALRSRVFNLRDKKNPALRENVLTGVISTDKFAVMTSEEMASDVIKTLRDKFTKEAINEHQLSVLTGTPSEMFKCGKCKKKNCTYTQVQTRSADEPMTTFVLCLECGNRWKLHNYQRMGEYSSFRSCVPMRKISVDDSNEIWTVFDAGPRDVACPVLFLPPLCGKADCYFKQMVSLSSKGYRVISLDWPEFWNIHEFCLALARLLDYMDLHSVHIFGSSLGGYLAQKFAETFYRSHKVASLILCNSFINTDIFGRNDASFIYWALPAILLRRFVMAGLSNDNIDADISDSVDFMVQSLETMPRTILASKLTLNCGRNYCNTPKVATLPMTIIDVFDNCALSELARQSMFDAYPNAKRAHLKSGGNFPFLSRSADVKGDSSAEI